MFNQVKANPGSCWRLEEPPQGQGVGGSLHTWAPLLGVYGGNCLTWFVLVSGLQLTALNLSKAFQIDFLEAVRKKQKKKCKGNYFGFKIN